MTPYLKILNLAHETTRDIERSRNGLLCLAPVQSTKDLHNVFGFKLAIADAFSTAVSADASRAGDCGPHPARRDIAYYLLAHAKFLRESHSLFASLQPVINLFYLFVCQPGAPVLFPASQALRSPARWIQIASQALARFRAKMSVVTAPMRNPFRVSTKAVRFSPRHSPLSGCITNIIGSSAKPKMLWIAAQGCITDVAHRHLVGNVPFKEFVRKTVRALPPFSIPAAAVSILGFRSSPDPARVGTAAPVKVRQDFGFQFFDVHICSRTASARAAQGGGYRRKR